jgi:hypothetical protein
MYAYTYTYILSAFEQLESLSGVGAYLVLALMFLHINSHIPQEHLEQGQGPPQDVAQHQNYTQS